MKTLYIDCTNGISGDMLLKALEALAEGAGGKTGHDHHGGSHEHHGRAYSEVQNIIKKANDIALSIYEVVAKAEAAVHGETIETVHFHEVGRYQAIRNAMCIGMAVAEIDPAEIIVSPINDGSGFVDCAHGRIPVPVPAVKAMMDECGRTYPNFSFRTCEDVDTEMVTPSGLAGLIGIGARPAPGTDAGAAGGMMFMEGTIIASSEAEGTRNTGRSGLKTYLIEK